MLRSFMRGYRDHFDFDLRDLPELNPLLGDFIDWCPVSPKEGYGCKPLHWAAPSQ